MARQLPYRAGKGLRMRIFVGVLIAFALVACSPTTGAGTSNNPGYRDSGLSKHTDQFTGRTVCEQSATRLTGRYNLKITARLDERGTYTFSLTHHRVDKVIHPPGGDYGFMLRYPGVEVWSHVVADYDFGRFVTYRGQLMVDHQFHTIIVDKAFYTRLFGARTDLSYRLIDGDEARQDSLDGVITLQHLEPLRAFFAQCL